MKKKKKRKKGEVKRGMEKVRPCCFKLIMLGQKVEKENGEEENGRGRGRGRYVID